MKTDTETDADAETDSGLISASRVITKFVSVAYL